jgi:hypothetical protein
MEHQERRVGEIVAEVFMPCGRLSRLSSFLRVDFALAALELAWANQSGDEMQLFRLPSP